MCLIVLDIKEEKMKLGILVLSIGSFGKKGFYNLQEIGLAKAIDNLGYEVKVYKLVTNAFEEREELIEGTKRATIRYMYSKSIGTNGVPNMDLIDSNIDALICFSDTQLMVKKVYSWTKKNNILLFPYIGVVESHSNNILNKILMNFLFRRNIQVYKKCNCFVKTPTVKRDLEKMRVHGTTVIPVGLDLDLLHQNYKDSSVEELKIQYGFSKDDKILLYIGRLSEEKQPLRMIDIFAEIRKHDNTYQLLMIGTGELKEEVNDRISRLGVHSAVQQIEAIPNRDIWKLYCFADSFVNLNQQEIFGMAILEAMYYGCKVVAWEAPGPNLIIENGKSGWLVNSNDTVIKKIIDSKDVGNNAHRRVVSEFTWENSAQKMISIIDKKDRFIVRPETKVRDTT